MTLFLDFDGCLHCDDVYHQPERGMYITRGMLFEHAAALEIALAPFPDLPIVLSTSWVQTVGYAAARSRLPTGIRERVVDATFSRRHTPHWNQQSRYQQIANYVSRRKLGDRWLAVDDDTTGWPASERRRLISPQGAVGLQPGDLEMLVTRIRAFSQ